MATNTQTVWIVQSMGLLELEILGVYRSEAQAVAASQRAKIKFANRQVVRIMERYLKLILFRRNRPPLDLDDVELEADVVTEELDELNRLKADGVLYSDRLLLDENRVDDFPLKTRIIIEHYEII